MPIYAAAGGELIIAEIEDITAWRSALNSVQLTKIREASLLNIPRLLAFVYDATPATLFPPLIPIGYFSPRHDTTILHGFPPIRFLRANVRQHNVEIVI